jgi:tight adherence protein C
MIAMTLTGAGLGAALFVLIWRMAAPSPSPLVQLGRFDAHHRNDQALRTGASEAGSSGPLLGVGSWAASELDRHGIPLTRLRQDLALTGHGIEWALSRKLLTGVTGFLLVVATGLTLELATGLVAPMGAPLVLALVVGVGLWFLTDVEAHRLASRRRREFRRALGMYLDLVALEMAGSAAPTEALPNAARVGTGWPMVLLRDTLWRATLSGTDQWQALTDLGERIGIGELRDLGTLVRLVDRDGARVRATLTARAATMRRRELAEAEGLAGQKEQSMRLAQILIGFGFITFISYPAIAAVMAL